VIRVNDFGNAPSDLARQWVHQGNIIPDCVGNKQSFLVWRQHDVMRLFADGHGFGDRARFHIHETHSGIPRIQYNRERGLSWLGGLRCSERHQSR
jgi:hypothetical protein